MDELKEEKRLKSKFYSMKKKGRNFGDFNDFIDWYNAQKKECVYCGITEKEMQELATKELKSARFPSGGGTRGIHLEIDRKMPKAEYSQDNCVLACYFCNNDKSDIFNYDEYKEFIKNRADYCRKRLRK